MAVSFTEKYPDVNASFSIEINRIIFSGNSPFQKIEILESSAFGKILVIDDCIMFTEKDEFIYHEMITHVPLYVHPRPARVLIIGGGDGGAVREVLKHSDVRKIVLVDIDRMVSDLCLKYFPAIAAGLLSERVTCLYQDGVEYVKNSQDKFDLIIIDSTDPVSVGEGLFTPEFYQDCHELLNDDGILVNQAESPLFTRRWLSMISRKLVDVFPRLHFYQANIPTYPSGYWLFGFASKKYNPREDFLRDKYSQQALQLKYYNEQLHQACFVLPNYVREIIGNR
jgi:spermidine synthase